MHNDQGSAHYEGWRIAVLGLLALLILMPVTLPIPVLKELVKDRFAVNEFWTSLFMSVNMIGAVLFAPIAGAAADRFGHRPQMIAVAMLTDALCFWLLTLEMPFALFMTVRFFEGCTHVFALSLLLGIAAEARPATGRGLSMGLAGAGLSLGVAIGAPIGGAVGAGNPLNTLYLGAAMHVFTAIIAFLVLRETGGAEHRPGFAEIRRALTARPLLFVPLLFAFIDRFTVGFFVSTFPLFLGSYHGLDPAKIGMLIFAFMGPFAFLAAPFGWLSQRTSLVWLLCGGSAVYGVLVASIGFWPVDALLAPMITTGIAAAVMFVPSMLLTTEFTPPSMRTTTMGAFNAAGSLGFIFGPITGGLVSQTVAVSYGYGWLTGYKAAFMVAGMSELLLVLVALPLLLHVERQRRERASGQGDTGPVVST